MLHKLTNPILSILVVYVTYYYFTSMSTLFYTSIILLFVFLIWWNTLGIYVDNIPNQPISYLFLNMFLSIILTLKYLESFIFKSPMGIESVLYFIVSIFIGLIIWFFVGVISFGLLDSLTDIDVINNKPDTEDPYNDRHANKILNKD